jgi:hypothetical protein
MMGLEKDKRKYLVARLGGRQLLSILHKSHQQSNCSLSRFQKQSHLNNVILTKIWTSGLEQYCYRSKLFFHIEYLESFIDDFPEKSQKEFD